MLSNVLPILPAGARPAAGAAHAPESWAGTRDDHDPLAARAGTCEWRGAAPIRGFILLGEAPTEQIEAAVRDALRRMRGGEHELAVHPNCGTNLVTTGLMTSVAAMIGLTAPAAVTPGIACRP